MFHAVAGVAGGAQSFELCGTQFAADGFGLVALDAINGGVFSVQMKLRIPVVRKLELLAGPIVRHRMTPCAISLKLAVVRILMAIGALGLQIVKLCERERLFRRRRHVAFVARYLRVSGDERIF